jgi:hypothetical protein
MDLSVDNWRQWVTKTPEELGLIAYRYKFPKSQWSFQEAIAFCKNKKFKAYCDYKSDRNFFLFYQLKDFDEPPRIIHEQFYILDDQKTYYLCDCIKPQPPAPMRAKTHCPMSEEDFKKLYEQSL